MDENHDDLEFHPLTAERWPDLEALFGPNGACAGCWCVYWRLRKPQMGTVHSESNREIFKAVVDSGQEPGVLAYAGGRPVGWCAIAPREQFLKLQNSRDLCPIADEPVWAITCFFFHRTYRRNALMTPILEAAVKHAAAHGARIVEGYPIEPGPHRMSSGNLFTGVRSAFDRVGFVEVARRNPSRPIVRYYITG